MPEDASSSILVIGGGVAGITSAIDLAEQGHRVYLLERKPSIGGRMAQLDKTFPTLDCSICILAPKMVEVSRHPNVTLLTYSEIDKVQPIGNGSKFRVEITRKPRYIDEEKCTGCRICVEKCPIKVPSEFEENLGQRKVVYIPFPQAVPAIAVIDRENCLYFQKGVCRVCEKFCTAKAVDLNQKERKMELEVASIIVATGFDLLDASTLPQYGFGRFPNVLTSMQYERLMNAAGPTGGRIVRLSDNVEPEKIAFIQCVGSRNVNVRPYCSQLCCMYATKEAIVTKEHNPQIDITIYYNDLRAAGKGHQELVRRACEEFNIKYVKGLPSEVQFDSKTNKLVIRSADLLNGEVQTNLVDMIILCPAVIPRKGSEELAKILGIDLNEFGFFTSTHPYASVEASVPGIYLSGGCEGPKDISHSVAQASAASAMAALHTGLVKGEVKRAKFREKPVVGQPRIGVFVCDCGINIRASVDVPRVVEFAGKSEGVAHKEELLFACSKDSIEKIKEAIGKHDLNRVVVASCTPRTHEPLFQAACEEAGLNPYLFEMVNIREHDSWVHSHEPEEATRKALELVQMAVAKAKLLYPLIRFEIEATRSALVIGGSIEGLMAAKAIADKGFKVYVLEEADRLAECRSGGYAIPFKCVDVNLLIEPLVKAVQSHGNIEVLTSAQLKDVRGALGNFDITVLQGGQSKTFRVGAVIVASQAEELKPDGLYGYGKYVNVVTKSDFRRMLKDKKLADHQTITMILCAGAREKEGRTYCSATCCSDALDLALQVKDEYPSLEVYILYRDMVLPLEGEKYYRQAREKGVVFIRYDEDHPPELTSLENRLKIEVEDSTAGFKLKIPADLVVLETPLVPSNENHNLASTLKVPLNTQGFFLEAHPKLRPLEFATDGIYVCGTCHSPQSITDSVSQALGVASKSLIPLMRGKVVSEAITALVDEDRCIACGNCDKVCEFGAIKVGRSVAEVNPFLCKGCGTCSVECPTLAITMHKFTNDQISSMIYAALEARPLGDKPKALAFFCNWCAYAAADMAGVSRFQYPPNVRIIRMMCTGRVDQTHILQAFLLGADGVIIGGCHPKDCHYISGNMKAEKRVTQMKEWLKAAGMQPERLRLVWASAGEGQMLSRILTEFAEDLEKLGPNPLRRVREGG